MTAAKNKVFIELLITWKVLFSEWFSGGDKPFVIGEIKPWWGRSLTGQEYFLVEWKILKTKPPSKYLLCKHRFKFLLFEYLDNRIYTAWKLAKDGVFSGPPFPAFWINTVKYGSEKTPYLDFFHAVVYRRKRNNKTVLSC